MRTRNGVYYDLSKSTYKYKVTDTGITYIFSSDLHLVKFEEQYEEHRREINVKLSSRYRMPFDYKNMPDLLLYKRIETRGFLIINEGGLKICLENLSLDGEKVTLKN